MGDDDKIIRLVSAFFIVLYLQGVVKDTGGIILLTLAGL
jgi:3D (Asp-Asp-Asp) domain-containing protein